jgi:hypothetical protein
MQVCGAIYGGFGLEVMPTETQVRHACDYLHAKSPHIVYSLDYLPLAFIFGSGKALLHLECFLNSFQKYIILYKSR